MPEIILPCPACGGTDLGCWEFVVCKDCEMRGPRDADESAAIAAWNTLPRALTWTHEPPKVAGWYWMRRKLHGKWRNRGIVHIYMDFAGTKTLQAKGWGRQVAGLENMGIDFEWAGPIAPPIE